MLSTNQQIVCMRVFYHEGLQYFLFMAMDFFIPPHDDFEIFEKTDTMEFRDGAPTTARQGSHPTMTFDENIQMPVFFLNNLSGRTLKTDFV